MFGSNRFIMSANSAVAFLLMIVVGTLILSTPTGRSSRLLRRRLQTLTWYQDPRTIELRTHVAGDHFAASSDAGVIDENLTPSFMWNSLPLRRREGFGVVFCAYSKDTSKSLPKFFKEAATSAQLLKANNPTIPVAIITNAKREDVPEVFDQIIKVEDTMLFSGESNRPDGIFRQWFSRIYYLAHSPFEVTWYVDSHAVIVTTELEQAFLEFESSSVDFAVASSNPTSLHLVCHNFAMLFRWNDRVKNLFVDWILEQLQAGIAADDQHTLCKALSYGKIKYGIKYAALSPQWAFALLSLNQSSWWSQRTTRVMSGRPHICHSSEGDLCRMASNEVNVRPRIYYLNRTGIVIPVYNETQATSLLPYPYPSYDWQVQADKCQGVVCTSSLRDSP